MFLNILSMFITPVLCLFFCPCHVILDGGGGRFRPPRFPLGSLRRGGCRGTYVIGVAEGNFALHP
jgi:hypothetical protein